MLTCELIILTQVVVTTSGYYPSFIYISAYGTTFKERAF